MRFSMAYRRGGTALFLTCAVIVYLLVLACVAPAAASAAPDGQGVLHFTVMVHLEGWDDDNKKEAFEKHAALVREYADLFEKYGARLTLESREFTAGCIRWGDNVLKEMEDRGHGVGVHADIGGSRKTTQKQLLTGIREMKEELESLGVTVRHVSGVCSDKDWVRACINAGYEAVTGTVSYALWSLDEANRPDGFEPYANPAAGHTAYPWDPAGAVSPWRTSDGRNWIQNDPKGKLLLIPSGASLVYAFEERNGKEHGGFDKDDLTAWRQILDEALTYTDSGSVNTYYAAWSLGSAVSTDVLEQWLRLIDEYVQDGRIVWTTVPEMIDLYNQNPV